MSKKFIQQHTRQVFNHLATSSDKSSSLPVASVNINVANPSTVVREIARQKYEQEQVVLKQQQIELEKRQQIKLLQEQQLSKQKEELVNLKTKLEQEKAKLLEEQQLKQQTQLIYEERLKQEKEKILQGESSLRDEQENFEKQKNEMILQAQELQNQITLLKETKQKNEYNINHPLPSISSSESTGIDQEYVEVEGQENHEIPQTEITLEGNLENNADSEYDFL